MTKRPSRHGFETWNPNLSETTAPRSHNMAKKIPSSKFPTTKKKIPSRKFPTAKTKIPSRKFAKGTAKIASRPFPKAPAAASEEPVAPVLPDRRPTKKPVKIASKP
jgi:hypothetical protein